MSQHTAMSFIGEVPTVVIAVADPFLRYAHISAVAQSPVLLLDASVCAPSLVFRLRAVLHVVASLLHRHASAGYLEKDHMKSWFYSSQNIFDCWRVSRLHINCLTNYPRGKSHGSMPAACILGAINHYDPSISSIFTKMDGSLWS